jgi:circadian clock protein KaiC
MRVLAVVKLRGSTHSNELRLFHIDADGIKIGEMIPGREGLLSGQPSRDQKTDAPDSGVDDD